MTWLATHVLGWLGPVGAILILAVIGIAATVFLGRWAAVAVVAVGMLLAAYLAGSREATRDVEARDLHARAVAAETTLASERAAHTRAVAALESDRAAAVERTEADKPVRLRILRVTPADDGPVARVLDDVLDHVGRTPR